MASFAPSVETHELFPLFPNSSVNKPSVQAHRLSVLSCTANRRLVQLPSVHAHVDRTRVRCSAASVGTGTVALPSGWAPFSRLVSGEWEGYACDFGPHGEPIPLPQAAVPEAFREWGLTLYAWQSHSSTLADEAGRVQARTVRYMPAVACDTLDPPVFSIHEETLGIDRPDTGVFAFRPDGSFAAARPGHSTLKTSSTFGSQKVMTREGVDEACLRFELEHCLVAEEEKGPEGEVKGSGRARVRVVQQYKRESVGSIPVLTGLTLFRERWVGAHSEPGAVDGGNTSFAEGPQVTLEAVEGQWLATKMEAEFPKTSPLGPPGTVVEMRSAGTEEVSRQLSEEGAIFLPQGVWSRVLPTASGRLILKAGWLVEADKAIVSRFDFSSAGQLEDIIISTEKRIGRFESI